MNAEIKDKPDSPAKNTYYCPCCGSNNTAVASIDRKYYEEPNIEHTTLLSIWCYNCAIPIDISVEVPHEYEPSPDIGSFNVMDPLTRHLTKREQHELGCDDGPTDYDDGGPDPHAEQEREHKEAARRIRLMDSGFDQDESADPIVDDPHNPEDPSAA